MEQSVARYRTALPKSLGAAGLVGGLAGGVGMAMWQMTYSAATGMGFWTPLNVCMASFVYRSEAAMMEREMMAHPGAAMMATPLQVTHLAVGAVLHMAFAMIVGAAFVFTLYALQHSGIAPILGSRLGYIAGSMGGAALLYVVMMYLVLPWANPLMCHTTPRTPFFVGHLVFGAVFGLVAYPVKNRLASRENLA